MTIGMYSCLSGPVVSQLGVSFTIQFIQSKWQLAQPRLLLVASELIDSCACQSPSSPK